MTDNKHRHKTISVRDLEVGMYVLDLGRKWLNHPWIKSRRLITSRREIDRLIEFGIKDVLVDLSKGVNVKRIPREETDSKGPSSLEELERRTGIRSDNPIAPVELNEELPVVRKTYGEAFGAVRYFMERAIKRGKLEFKPVLRVVNEITDSVHRNVDAFFSLAKVREYDKYDFAHPLLSSVTAMGFGRYLGMNRPQLMALGLGAMLQDLGKIHIPPQILFKRGPLTKDEYDLVKKHPLYSAKMIKDHPEITPPALSAVLYHHERADGSGYPKGMDRQVLNPFLIIGGLSDVFDALTADRVYKRKLTPFEALRVLFRQRGKQFPTTWVDRFVHYAGIYPTGTVVQLNTGEHAVVRAVNHAQLLRPKVLVVTDSQGRPAARVREIDLNSAPHAERSVTQVLKPSEAGIDPARFLDPVIEV
jgi:HD-GYP domain-containing protein (c-di-GMP phosphodiesterase class II)